MNSDRWQCAAVMAAALAAASGAFAQVVGDGNMDNLAVGNLPDNGTPNGAWAFPANYVTAGIAEPVARPEMYTVVLTNSFDAGAQGNSLRLNNPTGTAAENYHLPNIWSVPFTAADGLVLRVTFRIWVPAGANGGGSVYIGGDNGGGGFSNATGDRTAQLTWLPDGNLVYTNNAAANFPLTQYGRDAWQNVRIDIDTGARTWDSYWSMGNNPLAQIGNDLVFRAPNPALSVSYDRFSYVQFGGTVANAQSYLDDVVVSCLADFNRDGQVDFFDYLDFVQAFDAEDPSADFNSDGQVDFFDYLDFVSAFDLGCG